MSRIWSPRQQAHKEIRWIYEELIRKLQVSQKAVASKLISAETGITIPVSLGVLLRPQQASSIFLKPRF